LHTIRWANAGDFVVFDQDHLVFRGFSGLAIEQVTRANGYKLWSLRAGRYRGTQHERTSH
jgi:hypothetical protein